MWEPGTSLCVVKPRGKIGRGRHHLLVPIDLTEKCGRCFHVSPTCRHALPRDFFLRAGVRPASPGQHLEPINRASPVGIQALKCRHLEDRSPDCPSRGPFPVPGESERVKRGWWDRSKTRRATHTCISDRAFMHQSMEVLDSISEMGDFALPCEGDTPCPAPVPPPYPPSKLLTTSLFSGATKTRSNSEKKRHGKN